MNKLLPRASGINDCPRCVTCGTVIPPFRLHIDVRGHGLLCAACAPDFVRRTPSGRATPKIAGYAPPWQARDRAWFAHRPRRFLHLRAIMSGEEAALPLWPGWEHPEGLSMPARMAIVAIGETIVRRAPGRPWEPDGPRFAVLVIAYAPDCRERVTIPGLPRPFREPSQWDALAREAERHTTPPTADQLANLLARHKRGLLAQATSDAKDFIRAALRGGSRA